VYTHLDLLGLCPGSVHTLSRKSQVEGYTHQGTACPRKGKPKEQTLSLGLELCGKEILCNWEHLLEEEM
jgi:hypothetical protein